MSGVPPIPRKRATGHGAFFGLLSGTAAAAMTHGLTLAEGKGAWLGQSFQTFPSTMAQNFWIAIFAWTTCFVVTILVSLATSPKADAELRGLVYGPTEQPSEKGIVWYMRPAALALVVLGICFGLNLLFW